MNSKSVSPVPPAGSAGGSGSARAVGSASDTALQLVRWTVNSGSNVQSRGVVVIASGAHQWDGAAEGNGPVDAVFKAIESRVASGAELLLYSVNAITTGTESQGEVTVRLSRGGRIVNGIGADPDIVAASAKAYISALNRLHSTAERLNPQTSETV